MKSTIDILKTMHSDVRRANPSKQKQEITLDKAKTFIDNTEIAVQAPSGSIAETTGSSTK
jgi:hypothetical protein